MATRATVFPARSTAGPFLLHADQNEICTVNAGAVALIVYKGSFLMLLPAERKFVPLPAEFNTTKPCWIMGVEADNEAIILERAVASTAVEHKKDRVVEEHSPDETESVVSREEPKRKASVPEEPSRKRLLLESSVVRPEAKYMVQNPLKFVEDRIISASDWNRVVAKANTDLVGALLTVQLPNMPEHSAIIDGVMCNTLNKLCVLVKESPDSPPVRAMNWIRSKVGDFIKADSGDKAWWDFAFIKRKQQVRLDSVIPWSVKARKDKEAMMLYLKTDASHF